MNEEPCDRIDLYEKTHSTQKDGWKSNEEMMKKKQEEYVEQEIEKSSDEIVFEILGHGSRYIKGLEYGLKPPSRCQKSNTNDSSHLQEKSKASESHVNKLKTEVDDLKARLSIQVENMSQQAANINKLMSYLADRGINL